ncbi:MAG: PilZ domain-containing protein [Pseudohongiellaceae bacterium]
MSTQRVEKEDRGYFRITDWIGFECRELDTNEYRRLSQVSRQADVPALDELAEIDKEIQLVLSRLEIKSPYVADLGKLLNKKIQLVLEHTDIASGLLDLDTFPQTKVDISATGMAFPFSKAISPGEHLHLDLVLQAGRQHLSLLAEVIGCERDNETLAEDDSTLTHVVRVNFCDMSENISEFLIQYLVKRQGALLKSERLGS